MTTWKKSLLVGVAMLAAASPVLATADTAAFGGEGENLVPMPQGRELENEELLQARGEFWWFLIGVVAFGGGRAVYENWFDEDYGIDKDDLQEIALSGLGGGFGGACYGTLTAIAGLIPR